MLPAQYQYLYELKAPRVIVVALSLYGIREIVGPKHNPFILNMAKTLGIESIVKDDEQAWCGLLAAYVLHLAGKPNPLKSWDLLRALKYLEVGTPVSQPALGDLIIYGRKGGGHVNFYTGEDKECFHGIGGNQGNMINITRIERNRAVGFRRPHYNNIPSEVKKYILSPTGVISKNEA